MTQPPDDPAAGGEGKRPSTPDRPWAGEARGGNPASPPGEQLPAGRPASSAELIGLGAFLAAALVLPLVGGLELDRLLGTSPIGLAFGLLLGIVACCAGVYMKFREVR